MATLTKPQPALQDYLKAIHQLTEGAGPGARATTTGIARQLSVSAPSVSAMLDRMKAGGLVDYVHYAGASLTQPGQREALKVIRRHRLVELFLVEHLGLGWEEVHEEAERLEHVISERLESAIDALMGYPNRDPHGDPIPRVDGTVEQRSHRTLWSAESGSTVRVDRVSDASNELLRHLNEAGLVPGATVEVISRDRGGVIQLSVDTHGQTALGREAAEQVYVDA